jgi:hypothetical protein
MMLAGGGNGEPYRYFPGHIIVLRSIDSSNMVSVADPWDNSFVHHSYKLSEITKYGSYYVAVSY